MSTVVVQDVHQHPFALLIMRTWFSACSSMSSGKVRGAASSREYRPLSALKRTVQVTNVSRRYKARSSCFSPYLNKKNKHLTFFLLRSAPHPDVALIAEQLAEVSSHVRNFCSFAVIN